MQRTFFFIGCLYFLGFESSAQVDYLALKEQFTLSCQRPDSTTIIKNQLFLDSIAELKLSHGHWAYAYDSGWLYYMRYAVWKQAKDLKTACDYFEEAWERHGHVMALWNLGDLYRQMGQCERSIDATEAYLNAVPDSLDVDYELVYLRYKLCRGR